MAFRVLRVMEYVYDDFESYEADRGRWAVQGTVRHGRTIVRSQSFPVEKLLNDQPVEDQSVIDE